MPRVGFEPTITAFERVETVHVLDREAGHCDRLCHSLLSSQIQILSWTFVLKYRVSQISVNIKNISRINGNIQI
jgi:hypothetical protein